MSLSWKVRSATWRRSSQSRLGWQETGDEEPLHRCCTCAARVHASYCGDVPRLTWTGESRSADSRWSRIRFHPRLLSACLQPRLVRLEALFAKTFSSRWRGCGNHLITQPRGLLETNRRHCRSISVDNSGRSGPDFGRKQRHGRPLFVEFQNLGRLAIRVETLRSGNAAQATLARDPQLDHEPISRY